MAKKQNHRLTMIDIAEKANVSRMAVSHVLMGTGMGSVRVSDKTAERIREIARELGYVPNRAAQQLAGRKSGIIGIMGNAWSHDTEQRCLGWMLSKADSQGYRVLACQTKGLEESIRDNSIDFASRGIHGLIFIAHGNEHLWPKLSDLLAPLTTVVAVLGRPQLDQGAFVDFDRTLGTKIATEHLLNQGRKNIVQILEDDLSFDNKLRMKGFQAAFQERGLEVRDDQFIFATKGWSPWNPEFEVLTQQLMERKVDGILADSDGGAIGLLRHLTQKGVKVPDDIAVVGWGNEIFAPLFVPSITTVNFMLGEIFQEAVSLLISDSEIELETEIASKIIPPILIKRESA